MTDLIYQSGSNIPSVCTFTTATNPYFVQFLYNSADPSKSILFSADQGSARISAYQFNPNALAPGTTSSPTKIFTTGTAPFCVSAWRHPTDSTKSLLFVANGSSTNCWAYQFDPDNFGTSTVSTATKTFTTGLNSRTVLFWYNSTTPSKSWLFFANINSDQILAFQIDPDNFGTGNVSSPTKTFTTGVDPFGLIFWPNPVTPSQSLLMTACQSANRLNIFVVDPDNMGTGNVAAATKTYSCNAASWIDFWYNSANPSASILFGAESILAGTQLNQIKAFVIDPHNIGTGNVTTPTKSFGVGNTPRGIKFWHNTVDPTKSILFSADETVRQYSTHIINVSSFGTSNVSSPTKVFTANNTTRNLDFWYNPIDPTKSILFGATFGGNLIEAYTIFNANGFRNVISANNVSAEDPRISTSGNTITLNATVSFFELTSFLSLRSDPFAYFLGNTNYNQSGDSEITLNNDLVFANASTTISGNYILTMGSGSSITLAPRTYTESIVIPSDGTVLVLGDTTIAGDFTFSTGTTIARAPGVTDPVTVTVLNDPGLVRGTGVTIAAPQKTLTFTNVINDSELVIRISRSNQILFKGNVVGTSIQYIYNTSQTVDIAFYKEGYQTWTSRLFELPTSSQSIRVVQEVSSAWRSEL